MEREPLPALARVEVDDLLERRVALRAGEPGVTRLLQCSLRAPAVRPGLHRVDRRRRVRPGHPVPDRDPEADVMRGEALLALRLGARDVLAGDHREGVRPDRPGVGLVDDPQRVAVPDRVRRDEMRQAALSQLDVDGLGGRTAGSPGRACGARGREGPQGQQTRQRADDRDLARTGAPGLPPHMDPFRQSLPDIRIANVRQPISKPKAALNGASTPITIRASWTRLPSGPPPTLPACGRSRESG